MKLSRLIQSIASISIKGPKDLEVTGLSLDSRLVAPGHLFIAKKGTSQDGAAFSRDAVAAGARAIVSDLYDPFLPVTQVIHPDPALLTPQLASRFYRHPSKELFLFAATGTKGKTTSTYLAKQLLDALHRPSGLIGTVETIAGEIHFPSTLTTHDAIFNQRWLREMVEQKCPSACLEVSSHGLVQHRVDEIDLDVALFTNLFSDHLDYHITMDAYAAAKKRLFHLLDQSPKKKKRALVNGDSSWSPQMIEGMQTPVWTFGIDKPADVWGSDYRMTPQGACFTVSFQGQTLPFTTPLMGKFNVYNVLGAIALGLHLGYSLQDLQAPVSRLSGAPGRLQRVHRQVFVDFAHAGEPLAQALSTLKEMTKNRLWVIFGCGGNRDPRRRTEMAKAAEQYADHVVVTNDNPRSEPPEEICRQILSGFQDSSRVYVELDRKVAIAHAINSLQEGDLLLIAGKGHEKVQIFAHKTVPFDDVEIAREIIGSKL